MFANLTKTAKISCLRIVIFDNPRNDHVWENVLSYSNQDVRANNNVTALKLYIRESEPDRNEH